MDRCRKKAGADQIPSAGAELKPDEGKNPGGDFVRKRVKGQ